MSEEESVSYPSIDPSVFDLIVVGTGLPESIIAAAASVAGKTVLHVDSNSFYGSGFSSFSLDDFTSFLHAQKTLPESTLSHGSVVGGSSNVNGDTDYVIIDLKPKSLYSDIEISSLPEEESVKACSRKFNLDISGPRVMFCADSVVNLLLNSGGIHHVEFKSIDGSFIYGANGELSSVPDSRSAIFKDRSLGLTEKNQLMRFFKLVQAHIEGSTEHAEGSHESRRIKDEDLESPFIEFLNKQRLPTKIKSMILYAIAMADYDQEKPELCKNLLKTKDGIESLALFHSSIGRFTNALGAMIYPIYGQGELPQAFCRCAAVKGAIYVLRIPVTALLLSKENGDYKGVRLASGQDILSRHLVINPSVTCPSPPLLPRAPNLPEECSESDDKGEVIEKVARGICIIRGSMKSELSNLLVIFPPRSLCSEQLSSIRVLQLGSGLSVCPSGMSVLYLSTLCVDVIQGKKSLYAAMNTLVVPPPSENPEDTSSIQSENAGDAKPTLLWNAMFIQELEKASSGGAITSCPTPDGNLDYRNILESSEKLFHQIYQEEFFPKTSASEEIVNNDET
ncbi:hypothetical protein MKW98_011567 [Papaver atlanticum]|uniref:Rab escort protein 1 n=1 Tax=Papaver atlanticum TaxID=357466 RepID=A0AAD4XAP4_9MAGN|nr:hypothetical protein MKW98_011567 [Papaver atlanticum]